MVWAIWLWYGIRERRICGTPITISGRAACWVQMAAISAEVQTRQLAQRAAFIKPILWTINLLAGAVLLLFIYGYAARSYAAFKKHTEAYAYVAPAMIGMLVLVFFPFAYGITLSFTDTTLFNESLPFQERLIGLENFKDILGDFNLFTSVLRTASAGITRISTGHSSSP